MIMVEGISQLLQFSQSLHRVGNGHQTFVQRNDLPCGIKAVWLEITTSQPPPIFGMKKACQNGDYSLVQVLIEDKKNIHVKDYVNSRLFCLQSFCLLIDISYSAPLGLYLWTFGNCLTSFGEWRRHQL
jgi:hypothetical protein